MNSIEAMKNRKSTRTFQDQSLDQIVIQRIEELLANINCMTTPFGSNIKLGFISLKKGAKTHSGDKIGTYGVIKNQQGYIYGVAPKTIEGTIDFSYQFQRAITELTKIGVDTVWLGGTFSRKGLLKEVELADGETVPAITPVGFAADKRRFGEKLARKLTKTTQRKESNELFFENDFSTPLTVEVMEELSDAFEMVRIGPSAMNAQTWRLIKVGNSVHFYNELTQKNYNKEMMRWYQLLDVGIAMYHFQEAAEELGITGSFKKCDPEIAVESSTITYYATFTTQFFCSK